MQVKETAPVVLFVYNRPAHTEQAIKSLQKNAAAKDTVLYVFADGPKEHATVQDKKNIRETRALFKGLSGFQEIILVEKEKNQGLAASVVAGVTEVVSKHGRVIVLEDDLLVSPYFLDFMNDGLTMYGSSAQVYSINGFMYPLRYATKDVVLLPYTSTWGWATWKEKWAAFSPQMEGKEFLTGNPFLAARFNLGDYRYTDMLNFGNNSWGIKWYYSVFLRGGLNVYPTHSLVSNIGFDGSGTNGGISREGEISVLKSVKIQMKLRETIDLAFFDKFANHFKKENLSLPKRSVKLLKRAIKKLK